jgi:hypothetical protein
VQAEPVEASGPTQLRYSTIAEWSWLASATSNTSMKNSVGSVSAPLAYGIPWDDVANASFSHIAKHLHTVSVLPSFPTFDSIIASY